MTAPAEAAVEAAVKSPRVLLAILVTLALVAAVAAVGLTIYGRKHPCEGCLEKLQQDVVDSAEEATRQAAD